jgi:hypothetical protein
VVAHEVEPGVQTLAGPVKLMRARKGLLEELGAIETMKQRVTSNRSIERCDECGRERAAVGEQVVAQARDELVFSVRANSSAASTW